MDGDITYPDLLREAITVSKRVGTWLIYMIQDEPKIDYVIGYLRGRIVDFVRRGKRAKRASTKLHYKDRISYWKRAINLVQRMGQSQHQELARRVVADIERDTEYRNLPYVADAEVSPGRSHTCGKLRERPSRRPGKPRVLPLEPVDFRVCESCHGEGFLRRFGGQQ